MILSVLNINDLILNSVKKNLILTVVFLLPFHLWAQKGLLWEISGNGLEKSSYLLGTIHAICPDDYFEPDGFLQAMKNSNAICLEIDVTDPQMGMKMQRALIDPLQRNVKSELDVEAAAAVDSLMHKYMMAGIDKLGILKPWAIASTFSLLTLFDCATPRQYETELAMFARQENLPILSLETIDFQIDMFDSWDRADQIQMVSDLVKEKEKNRLLLKRLIACYQLQDLDALQQLTCEQVEYQKYNTVLLDERNRAWIPLMQTMMQQQSVFFGVGAAHLGGVNGVINLLREAGYSVEPFVAKQF